MGAPRRRDGRQYAAIAAFAGAVVLLGLVVHKFLLPADHDAGPAVGDDGAELEHAERL